MTTITEKMTKIGKLQGLTGTIVVYQDGSEFFYQSSGWTMNDKDEEIHIERESERFPSLERLLAPFPRGLHFQKEGEIETREAYIKRMKKISSHDDGFERLQKAYEDRLREFGTTDFTEMIAIIEAREKDGTYVPPPPEKEPFPEQMVKIGTLQGRVGKGTIYQHDRQFLYLSSGWTQPEIDDGIYIDERSNKFSTLDGLLATIPRGIDFQPEEP